MSVMILIRPWSLPSVTVKDVKALLPQINYRVPNMRFLKDKLQVRTQAIPPTLTLSCKFRLSSPLRFQEVEARSELTFPNFSQLYRTLMFDAQKNVSGSKASSMFLFLCSGDDSKELKSLTW